MGEVKLLKFCFLCVNLFVMHVITALLWTLEPDFAVIDDCKLTFDLLTLKVVSESHVTCANCVQIWSS